METGVAEDDSVLVRTGFGKHCTGLNTVDIESVVGDAEIAVEENCICSSVPMIDVVICWSAEVIVLIMEVVILSSMLVNGSKSEEQFK